MRYRSIALALAIAGTGLAETTTTLSTEGHGRDAKGALGQTFFWENDGAYTNILNQSDRWNTSSLGGAIQWQSEETDDLLSLIPSFGGEFDSGDYAAGLAFSLNIFTPADIEDPNIRQGDRPYSGWTYLGPMVQRANRELKTPIYEHIQLDLGTLGPRSRADDAQTWAHSLGSAPEPQGWQYQVRNEWGADLRYQRRWRIQLMEPERPTGPALQLLPDAGFVAGTVHINATGGAMLRYGWNLPDDFGPGNLRFADDFTRPMGPNSGLAKGVSGYFFLRPGVKVVAFDATMGDTFFHHNVVEVSPEPVVGEFSFGAVVTFLRHCRFGYTQTLLSPEFEGQGAWQSVGAYSVSVVFTW